MTSVDHTPERAEQIARRLDVPMGALGVIFVFVVLGQSLATSPALVRTLQVVGWLLWCVFVAELAFRAYVAGDQRAFWRRNWWQLLFLAVPFLRFARALVLVRSARVGVVAAAAVRGSRSAGRLLTDRIAWLAAVTLIVMLASSQLLHLTGEFDTYGDALYAAALATVVGEPLRIDNAWGRLLGVVLAVYSVVVFAALAATFGAFLLRDRNEAQDRE